MDSAMDIDKVNIAEVVGEKFDGMVEFIFSPVCENINRFLFYFRMSSSFLIITKGFPHWNLWHNFI